MQQIDQVQQRVRRYRYEDGIAELTTGGFFVLLGAYFGLQGYLAEDSTIGAILQVSMVLVLVLGIYAVRRVVSSLKSRITYPRTGFVEYRAQPKSTLQRYGAAILAALVGAGLMILYRIVQGLDSVVLATGIIAGFILIVLPARATGIKRFYLMGALSLVLGFVLSLSGLPQAYNLALFYGLLGVAMMISGGWTLRKYLKVSPVAAEGRNEHGSA